MPFSPKWIFDSQSAFFNVVQRLACQSLTSQTQNYQYASEAVIAPILTSSDGPGPSNPPSEVLVELKPAGIFRAFRDRHGKVLIVFLKARVNIGKLRRMELRVRIRIGPGLGGMLQLVSKPLSAAIGCKACGSAFSAKRVLNVPQHASEPFSPRALTTSFSLDLTAKQVLKPVVGPSTIS